MATMSVSGVVSGMDWDSMIDELITKAAKPAQVQVAKRSNLTNKKSLFEEMKVTMNSLQSSLTPLKLPSTYKAKEVDIERIDTNGSYKGVLTATVNADAEVNVYDLKVNQLARAQTNRSRQITSSNVGSALNGQGISSGTMYINMAGQKVGIDITSNDSLQSIKSKINTTLKTLDIPVEVTASVVDNRLILRSDNTGTGANSLTETLNYNLNGRNTITSFNVNDSYLGTDNFVIRSNGSKLTYGKDYDVVNGNEIRWNQYETTDNVKLGESVKATYKIAKGDVYESSGTYGTSEAKVSGITVKDNDTLSSRIKIVDEDGNEYVYGKDFTLDSSGKVEWIAEEEKTNEPGTYTVSYTKTTDKSYSISGEKISLLKVPDSYKVNYSLTSSEKPDITRGSGNSDLNLGIASFSYDQLSNMGVPMLAVGSGISYVVDPYNPNQTGWTIEAVDENNVKYSYGNDFIFRYQGSGYSEAATWDTAQFMNAYQSAFITANGIAAPFTPNDDGPAAGVKYQINLDFKKTYTTGSETSSELTQLHTLLSSALSSKNGEIAITDSDDKVYTKDTHYEIKNNGEIVWKIKNEAIDVTMDGFKELQEKYAEAYAASHNGASTTLSTVTLIDGDNVLRTYVDPDDPSIFNMTADGKTYEYGRDYVLRVNDAGTGYMFQWLVEDSDSITDASTVVATYAAHKNISTSKWQAAPDDGKTYNFGFSYTNTETTTKSVNSSATDKTLAAILGESLNSSEYSSVKITNGSTTYTEGKDYVIDSEGSIRWLDQNTTDVTAYKAAYTFRTDKLDPVSNMTKVNDTAVSTNGLDSLKNLGVNSSPMGKVNTSMSSAYTYVDIAEGKAAFTLTDSSGNVYEYGRDFAVRSSNDSNKTLQIVTSENGYWPDEFGKRDTEKEGKVPLSEVTLTFNNTVERIIDSSATIEDALGFIPSDWSKLTISNPASDDDDNQYIEDTDYTIDTSTGEITWLNTAEGPSHPDEDTSYTLIYDPFITTLAAGTFEEEETQEILISAGDGNYLSYAQILSDAGLTSSSTEEEIDGTFAQYFSMVDENGAEYEYGVDYRIIKGSDEDSGKTMIEWIIDGGYQPVSGTNFTLSYSGRTNDTIELEVERSYTDAIQTGTSGATPLYSYFDGGTTTITQGSKTFYEGIDYEIVKTPSTATDDYGNAVMHAAVEWKTGTNSEWYYPTSNARYTINLTTSNGRELSFSAVRNPVDSLDLRDYGFTSVNGSITGVTYDGEFWDLTTPAETTITEDDEGETEETTTPSGRDKARNALGLNVTDGTNGGFNIFNFNWVEPAKTANEDLPGSGEEFTVEYTYNANTFTLSDDSDGKLLAAFELDQTDEEHYTAAQNAELELDGEIITRDSNDIGESYDNELIKGMTIHLKGIGEVSLDVAHDAQKAVESIQTFVDTYNDLMSWMNTRMTESQVDKDTEATIDSDDFRMRWGLLHGNSLLRQTKSTMRSLISQNFTFSFTQRSSAEEIYGTMGYNGLRNDATLRLRIASKFVDVSILPTDTLKDIIDKINDDTKGGAMNDIYYDDEGNKLAQPLLKASIENDRLVISSTGTDPITMSGTSAMNALKMNYTYKGLYQLGIATTSTDYGKSGELEFDANTFMEALEDNADEVQELMLMFASEFDTWTKSMLNSSASGETSGTLTRQIEDLESQISTIDEYLEKYQDRLDKQEEQLQKKYASTETSLAKLTQQASSIAAILNQLNGYANNNSSSS